MLKSSRSGTSDLSVPPHRDRIAKFSTDTLRMSSVVAIAINRFVGMSTTRQRRPHGSNANRSQVVVRVGPEIKAKIDRVADALAISQSAAFELIVENIEVDANGRPSFYDGPLATDVNEELPLASSA